MTLDKQKQRRSRQASVVAQEWLKQHAPGADMLQTAHRLMAIQTALAGALPTSLAHAAKAARLEQGCLTVIVPGAAHAARLRQMTSATSQRLRQAGWPVDDIVIQIDARAQPRATKTSRRRAAGLEPAALACFEELGRNVAPGPLADAIQRLLHRQRNKAS